jgi:pilus assembly protein Flp/PilA
MKGSETLWEEAPMATALPVIVTWLRARVSDEAGQGLVEYGLILALIAIVVIAALTGLGSTIGSLVQKFTVALQ